MTSKTRVFLAAALLGAACHAWAADAFRPGALWLDDKGGHINAHGGGILEHDGVYYWFGEHKVAGTAGNRAQVGVHVYSSRNLTDWHDEGIALAVSEDPASDIVRDAPGSGRVTRTRSIVMPSRRRTFRRPSPAPSRRLPRRCGRHPAPDPAARLCATACRRAR